jgi:hypothetical protein
MCSWPSIVGTTWKASKIVFWDAKVMALDVVVDMVRSIAAVLRLLG